MQTFTTATKLKVAHSHLRFSRAVRARGRTHFDHVPSSTMTPSQSEPGQSFGAFVATPVVVCGREKGSLNGLTLAVKDLFDALLDAGAKVVGKTHTDELAYSLNGENMHYGTPTNPAAPARIPGGSSSGSVVAVAAGLVDIALGSDTGGSVRVPASYCGVLCLRPTHGRISLQHACPLAPSFDTVGWFARDASTLRRVGSVLLSAESRGPTRLGRWLVAADAFELAEKQTTDAIYEALSRNMGAVSAVLGQPSEVRVAAPLAELGIGSLSDWLEVFRVCQAKEVWEAHGAWVTQHQPVFGPGIRERFDLASKVTQEQVDQKRQLRARIRDHMIALLGDDGVLALPSAPGPAPFLNTPAAQLDDWRKRLISLTSIAGLAGLPQVSLPVALVDGAPVGLGLIGPPGADEALLEVAEKLMAAVGHAGER